VYENLAEIPPATVLPVPIEQTTLTPGALGESLCSGVTVVLQWCYSGVTVLSKWRCSDVKVVCNKSITAVTTLSHIL
jgi:hypothetical protein